eukprot:9330970-Pyramimonas_sp.AAC.1
MGCIQRIALLYWSVLPMHQDWSKGTGTIMRPMPAISVGNLPPDEQMILASGFCPTSTTCLGFSIHNFSR